jgi:AraC-like DNA-binding protein
MKPRHEELGTSDGTTFRSFVRGRPLRFGWHFHREYELTLIVSGRGTRYVGTTIEQFGPGDLVLLGQDLPHAYASDQSDGPAHAVVTQFRHEFLGDGFFALPQFRHIGHLLDRAARGLRFDAGADEIRDALAILPHRDGGLRTIELMGALHSLAQTAAVPISGPEPIATPSPTARERIDLVSRHLQHTHTKPVSQVEIAALVHMSPTSFSHFFRRTMGRTLTDYVSQLRIETACTMLAETSLPVTQVAERSGFRNLSNFNRRFRILKGMTPLRYRAAYLEGKALGSHQPSLRSQWAMSHLPPR